MTLKETDHDLIQAFITQGDRRSFNSLILKYQDQVYNFCYRFLGNHDDAEDTAQEVFIKLYQKLQLFRFESSFSSWLYRVMMNACKETVRSKQYKMRKQSNELDQALNQSSGNSDDPEKTLMQSELDQAFQSGLMKLKPAHRTVIILRDLEGHSYEEIAKQTGMKMGTVRSSLARARKKMANELKEFQHV